jgi:hypothetical protein
MGNDLAGGGRAMVDARAALPIAAGDDALQSAPRLRSSGSEHLPPAVVARSASPMTAWSRRGHPGGLASMRAGRSPRLLAALVIALALAACGSARDRLIEQGFPPAYAEGYDDGCASGEAAGGGLFGETRKDANRYATDNQYAKGWDDAFATCRDRAAAMVRDARLRNPSRDK